MPADVRLSTLSNEVSTGHQGQPPMAIVPYVRVYERCLPDFF